ncbi:hypothetical protein KFL_005080020 [Klebsormidium nitens]|uniref:Transmembrane protein n=1 Tax=Klebsormidium nitens TaxID=105231 RepID=A0A1Y1IF98_KLENI|nr:hypothetical protein KFL_005080020 [Klebsormidium nitens]|eukprot:GAQ89293.1 hypothetical protein KFL_005080020 [Klebsormidium nitens]
MTMSALSNGSHTSRGSSLSYGSLGSVGRWKLDEQKRRLREAKRRASGCVQEIKVLKEECSGLSAKINDDEIKQQGLQEQKEQLQTSPAGGSQLAEIEEKLREIRKQIKADKMELDKATKLLDERLEDQRLLYEQLLTDEKAIQKAENEETSSTDAALQRELKHLSEEMLRLQGLCQEMQELQTQCSTVKEQEEESALVLRPQDENVVSGLSSKRELHGSSGKNAVIRQERDQLERELAAAKAVADSIRREAEEKAASRQQQLTALTEELEHLKAANAELSQEVPLLSAQNQQLKDEQEAQARRTEELQMTIDYMQEWQAVLKQKVARSTGKSFGGVNDQGSAERGGASAERNRGGLAKRLDFEDGMLSPDSVAQNRTPDSEMRGRDACARIFVQGLERAMVGTPLTVPVQEEEGDLLQLVRDVERDMGGERIRELESLVSKLTSEAEELRKGSLEDALAAGEQGEEEPFEKEANLVQQLAEEQAKREAAERRSEELARQLMDQALFGNAQDTNGILEDAGRRQGVAVQGSEESDVPGGLLSDASHSVNLDEMVANLSQKLSQTEAAREEAEETVFELVKDLATLRGQYEASRRDKRIASSLQREYEALTRRLTWRSVLVAAQVALFLYFAFAVAGELGLCGFLSPT